MSLSKNKLKWVRSLALKKNRDAEGLFLAEGPKTVEDLSSAFRLRTLLTTPAYLPRATQLDAGAVVEVSQDELERASQLKTPHDCLAVFEKPQPAVAPAFDSAGTLVLALDGVQDPGNLGTILRLADWFGITDVYCSLECADAYSPKTVQATMGALARVACHYLPLAEFLSELPAHIPIYGTFLDGDNLYEKDLRQGGVLVMGNEGRGISPAIERQVNERLFIPNYPPSRPTSESLNVAVATAITVAEFRRQLGR